MVAVLGAIQHRNVEPIESGLPVGRPLIIAHRGSSGMLPEHTLAAYQLAIDQGADVVECDVVMTRDDEMICMHDAWMMDSTDVEQHQEFAHRKRNVTIDGLLRFDYFTFDFTLQEIKTLRVKQSRDYRDQSYNGLYEVPTLREYITLISTNSTSKAIYPELKYPSFFNSLNRTERMEDMLIAELARFGYSSSQSPCLVQCFELGSLEYLHNRTELPLVYLTHTAPLNKSLDRISEYLYGIGISKTGVVRVDGSGHVIGTTDFIERCHQRGMKVHAWTFRNEDQFLSYTYGADPYREYRQFYDLNLDGYFTDFPQSLNDFMQGVNCLAVSDATNSSRKVHSISLLFAISFLAQAFFNISS